MQREDKGVTIRQPATANLMVDSSDRKEAVNPSPFDFQINKNNSIMNGFFTRIGTTEVVLEWNDPNGAFLTNLSTTFELTPGGTQSTINVEFPNAFLTAQKALGFFTSSISTAGGNFTLSNGADTNIYVASPTGCGFEFEGDLSSAIKLGFQSDLTVLRPSRSVDAPDLRPFRYLDFVSQQLTYNQDLKDNATNNNNKDVLCRWYMAWDNPNTYDNLGFPILQGYTPFVERRLFNPPKQIKWNPEQPIGQLSFQVYGDDSGSPVQPYPNTNFAYSQWLMTLQLSEN